MHKLNLPADGGGDISQRSVHNGKTTKYSHSCRRERVTPGLALTTATLKEDLFGLPQEPSRRTPTGAPLSQTTVVLTGTYKTVL
eukprot:3954218-Pleurochrysis_carterae.AAC.1